MQRPEHELDHQFRRRLREAEVPPPPAVWEGVQAALRRRRRRVVGWWLAGLLGLGAAGFGIWLGFPAPTLPSSARTKGDIPFWALPSPSQHAAPTPERDAAALRPTLRAPTQPQPSAQCLEAPLASQRTRSPSGKPQQHLEVAHVPSLAVPLPKKAVFPDASALPLLPSPALAALSVAPHLPEIASAPLAAEKPNAQSTKRCYRFSQKGEVWMLDAYGGPSWSLPTWRFHNSELDTYAAARRRTETPDGAFNAGLRVSYYFHPNLALRTGLHYDQWVDRFEYSDPNFIRYHVIITQKLINGQWMSVADTIGVEYGSEYRKTYNRFGLLDLPLQISAEGRRGEMGFSLNAGVSINVLFHKRGYLLDMDGQPVSFTPGSAESRSVYRPRAGWSIGGSAQWFYHVAPRTRTFVEPYFRVVLRPITLPSFPIQQSHNIAGLRLGVSYILNKK